MALPLCNQTVTCYRRSDGEVKRRVISGCYYDWRVIQKTSLTGVEQDTVFLLILPPGESVLPGDRIYDGVGPENVDWDTFLPNLVPGFSQAAWVRPCFAGSSLHHTEAGND